jgi:hypothetical protein
MNSVISKDEGEPVCDLFSAMNLDNNNQSARPVVLNRFGRRVKPYAEWDLSGSDQDYVMSDDRDYHPSHESDESDEDDGAPLIEMQF